MDLNKIFFALLLTLPLSSASASEENSLVFRGKTYPLEIQLNPDSKAGTILYDSGLSEASPLSYDTVLLQGEMPDPNISLEIWVKKHSLFKTFDRYQNPVMRRFQNGRFWAKFRLAPSTTPMKLIVINTGVTQQCVLKIYSLEVFREATVKEARIDTRLEPAVYQPEPDLFISTAIPFAVIRRETWAAAAPTEAYTRHFPSMFTIHHTMGSSPKTLEESIAEMLFIQDYHQTGRGWIDIGYHFLIDPLGNIFEGRPIHAVGAHAKGHNTGNIGIAVMGNYHPPEAQTPTSESLNSFVTLGSYIKDAYTVSISSFYAHKDIRATECPGENLYSKMAELKLRIFPQPIPVIVDPTPVISDQPSDSTAMQQLQQYDPE